jgi:hypothetical protein
LLSCAKPFSSENGFFFYIGVGAFPDFWREEDQGAKLWQSTARAGLGQSAIARLEPSGENRRAQPPSSWVLFLDSLIGTGQNMTGRMIDPNARHGSLAVRQNGEKAGGVNKSNLSCLTISPSTSYSLPLGFVFGPCLTK